MPSIYVDISVDDVIDELSQTEKVELFDKLKNEIGNKKNSPDDIVVLLRELEVFDLEAMLKQLQEMARCYEKEYIVINAMNELGVHS